MVHGMTWSAKLNQQAGYRMRYRMDSDIVRERVAGDWTGRDTGELTGNVLQEARERCSKSTHRKSQTWTRGCESSSRGDKGCRHNRRAIC